MTIDRSLVAGLPHDPASSFDADSANLDFIRAAAVLLVFFSHLWDISRGEHALAPWHLGQIGVLIFFVHTSMVLMLSLDRTRLQGLPLLLSFYVRRIFRLYPLSIFCVTVAMVSCRAPDPAAPLRHWRLAEYLSNLLLTTNLTYSDNMVGGLWSLPVEAQMYLGLPCLFLLGRSRPMRVLAAFWLLSVPVAMLQLHTCARLSAVGYAPCFVAGAIAWKLSTSIKRRLPGWLWPFAAASVAPVFFCARRQNDMHFRWIFCLALALLIPWFREIGSRPLRSVAHIVARYSYGIYLSHVAVMLWSFSLPVPAWFRWAICGVLAVAVPAAMFHGIEGPMIAAGQRVAARLGVGKRNPSHAAAMEFRESARLSCGRPNASNWTGAYPP